MTDLPLQDDAPAPLWVRFLLGLLILIPVLVLGGVLQNTFRSDPLRRLPNRAEIEAEWGDRLLTFRRIGRADEGVIHLDGSFERLPSIPSDLRALDGETVAMLGFMAPFDSLERFERIMIMPTMVGCYFCVPPSMNQVVYAEQKDRDAPFYDDPVLVVGRLHLWTPDSRAPYHRDGYLFAILESEVTPVDPAAPFIPAGDRAPAPDHLGDHLAPPGVSGPK